MFVIFCLFCHFCHFCDFCDFCEGGEGSGEKGRGVKMLQTYRPSEEAGPRGAFAPKNYNIYTDKQKRLSLVFK